MSRYNGGSSGGSNDGNNDYEDQRTVKLQQYTTISSDLSGIITSSHDQYGTSLIAKYNDFNVLDGIVFQRDDKPQTWKVFSPGKFFHLNAEDGLVYEDYDEDAEEYTGEMSAQDILDHPRIAGFSENFGGTDYFYQPIGVVIEASGDLVVDEDMLTDDEIETTQKEGVIPVGEASMFLGNKSWVRTYAKKISEEADGVINDVEGEDNPKYDAHEWLTTEEPTLRTELEGRTLELWITEETTQFEDGGEATYEVPNLLDVKTDNFVTIDNGINSDHDSGTSSEKAAATDGGTATQDTTESDTESTETTDSPDDAVLPDGVPDALDGVLDYMAKNDKTDPDQIRSFAADEVNSPDDVDWEAAAEVAEERAE
jgi:hypothetical protein